jgi:hypothetical protein
MNQAKSLGGNQYSYYSDEISKQAIKKKTRKADKNSN